MKQDRFLTGILIGIGILIVLALVVFFVRQPSTAYVPDDTPEGVVQDYVQAALNKDYQKAYGYLADLNQKPDYDAFRQAFAVGRLNAGNTGLKIGSADITGDSATVDVTMVNASGDPFSSGFNDLGRAQLVLQNGAWKISSMPAYNLWDFSWYQVPPAKIP